MTCFTAGSFAVANTPAIDLLIRLYQAVGKPAEAAKWRAERAKYPPETAPHPRPTR